MILFGFVNSKSLSLVCSTGIYFFIVGAWATIYVYTPEVFPTVLRSSSSGFTRVFSSIGTILAPPLGLAFLRIFFWLPLIVYGVVLLLTAVIALFLPYETSRKDLNDTLNSKTITEEHLPILHDKT